MIDVPQPSAIYDPFSFARGLGLSIIDVTRPPYRAGATSDDTDAILGAVHDLPSGGGIVFVPGPQIYPTSATIDLTTGPSQVHLLGVGARSSIIVSSVTDTPAIYATNLSTRHTRISSLGIRQSGLVLPAVARPGNNGILAEQFGYGLNIEYCEVLFFGDDGILVRGATGNTSLFCNSLQRNAGYGAALRTYLGFAPEDCIIYGGNSQANWGGYYFNCSTANAIGSDIEGNTKYPAVHVFQAAAVTLMGLSCECDDVLVPAALLHVEDSPSIHWLGGVLFVDTNATAVDNIRVTGAASINNIFDGGRCYNKADGYYAQVLNGAGFNRFNANLVPGLFSAGKAKVLNAAGNGNKTTTQWVDQDAIPNAGGIIAPAFTPY